MPPRGAAVHSTHSIATYIVSPCTKATRCARAPWRTRASAPPAARQPHDKVSTAAAARLSPHVGAQARARARAHARRTGTARRREKTSTHHDGGDLHVGACLVREVQHAVAHLPSPLLQQGERIERALLNRKGVAKPLADCTLHTQGEVFTQRERSKHPRHTQASTRNLRR